MVAKKAAAKKPAAKKQGTVYGPFDENTVVVNDHGSFGLPAGQTLVVKAKKVKGPGRDNTEIETVYN